MSCSFCIHRFFFLCNRWLAVEEEDGMVDRLLPVANINDVTNFSNLFSTTTRKKLTDSHLWISVLSRPNRSHFTRVERVTVILSLLYTTMVANAMFFRSEERITEANQLRIGPIIFTAQQVFISIVSSLVVLPVNIVIDQLFRRSVPKRNNISPEVQPKKNKLFKFNLNIFNTLNKGKHAKQTSSEDQIRSSNIPSVTGDLHFKSPSPAPSSISQQKLLIDLRPSSGLSIDSAGVFSTSSDDVTNYNRQLAHFGRPSSGKRKRKKTSLPHWCAYIAWALAFISTFVSAFITFSYSMEWGKEKSEAWLSAMLLSIVQSVVVIQPSKVTH